MVRASGWVAWKRLADIGRPLGRVARCSSQLACLLLRRSDGAAQGLAGARARRSCPLEAVMSCGGRPGETESPRTCVWCCHPRGLSAGWAPGAARSTRCSGDSRIRRVSPDSLVARPPAVLFFFGTACLRALEERRCLGHILAVVASLIAARRWRSGAAGVRVCPHLDCLRGRGVHGFLIAFRAALARCSEHVPLIGPSRS